MRLNNRSSENAPILWFSPVSWLFSKCHVALRVFSGVGKWTINWSVAICFSRFRLLHRCEGFKPNCLIQCAIRSLWIAGGDDGLNFRTPRSVRLRRLMILPDLQPPSPKMISIKLTLPSITSNIPKSLSLFHHSGLGNKDSMPADRIRWIRSFAESFCQVYVFDPLFVTSTKPVLMKNSAGSFCNQIIFFSAFFFGMYKKKKGISLSFRFIWVTNSRRATQSTQRWRWARRWFE